MSGFTYLCGLVELMLSCFCGLPVTLCSQRFLSGKSPLFRSEFSSLRRDREL